MSTQHAHPVHNFFTRRGETASYKVRDGWMTVDWGGVRSRPHEVDKTPERALAEMMLVQMPEWVQKYPEDGVPNGKEG
jgi:hypothetical protein